MGSTLISKYKHLPDDCEFIRDDDIIVHQPCDDVIVIWRKAVSAVEFVVKEERFDFGGKVSVLNLLDSPNIRSTL